MRIVWHIIARFYEARSIRALNRHHALRCVAEKFFRKMEVRDAE